MTGEKGINDIVDKFNEVLKDIAGSKTVINDMIYDELRDFKISLNSLKNDVVKINDSTNRLLTATEDLAKITKSMSEEIEDTKKLKDKGRALVFAGKLLMWIGTGIGAFYLFLKDNAIDFLRYISK